MPVGIHASSSSSAAPIQLQQKKRPPPHHSPSCFCSSKPTLFDDGRTPHYY